MNLSCSEQMLQVRLHKDPTLLSSPTASISSIPHTPKFNISTSSFWKPKYRFSVNPLKRILWQWIATVSSCTIQKWVSGRSFLRGNRSVPKGFYKAFFFCILKSISVARQKGVDKLHPYTSNMQEVLVTAIRLKYQQQNLFHLHNQKVG